MMMSDARGIRMAASRLRAEGVPFLCATVVSVKGSSYRRPGARLIATPERRIAGCVSGGCLEKDLLRTSWWRTRNGPVVVRYDSADTESPQAALGCGGEVDVLIERANDSASDGMTLVERALASDRVCGLATVYRSESALIDVGTRFCLDSDFSSSSGSVLSAAVARECESAIRERTARSIAIVDDDARFDVLVEAVIPPPHVFVFGAGLDALPVVESVLRLGWNATVWEPHTRIDSRARFASTEASFVAGTQLDAMKKKIDGCDQALAIVMGHNVDQDRAALSMLLGSQARYIGILGPRHRTQKLIDSSASVLENDPRIHSPIGLDLGAETPEEIALSIAAEMLATSRKSGAASLRTQQLIHK
jgi:xanthine dehydrogenase accessory factor